MDLHPDSRAVLDLIADAPPLDTLTPAQNRENNARAGALRGAVQELAEVREDEIDGVPVRIYVPHGLGARPPAFVYFHAGGFVVGSPQMGDATVREVAVEAGAVAISADFRRAPETPFPGAVEDALTVTRAVLEGRGGPDLDPHRVAVLGESSGGNLAAVVAQQLRGSTPGLVHQGLVYPYLEPITARGGSRDEFAEGYVPTARDLAYYSAAYAAEADPGDTRLSPARERDLTGLPPATVLTAGCDPLRDEGEDYAEALAAAGTPVTSVRFAGHVHGFLHLAALIGAARTARRLLGAELRAAFAEERTTG